MATSKVFLSEKEEQILSTIRDSEKKLTLTELSKTIESSLPYTSNLVTMLEVKKYIKIERKDKRSKYVILTTEDERKPPETIKYKTDPVSTNLALKALSFFLSHSAEIGDFLTNKLLNSLSKKERDFISQYSSRIEELELTWET